MDIVLALRPLLFQVCCLAMMLFLGNASAMAQDAEANAAYSVLEQVHSRDVVAAAGQTPAAAAGQLSGLWTSSAYPGLEVRLVDKGGVLFGLVKVPNILTGGDLYHVSGGYSGSTVVLHHFSQGNYKVFIGSLSGSSITGTLTVNNYSYVPISTLTGLTITKSPASGQALSRNSLAGRWSARVLSKSIAGSMTMALSSGLGEQVGHLDGSLQVPVASGTAPYHFVGYYLNNGEVFLVNTSASGAVFRTLLGVAGANGASVTAAVEENTTYFAGANVTPSKVVFSVAAALLMNSN